MNFGTWLFLGLGVLCTFYGLWFKFGKLPAGYRARWYHTVRRNPDATHEMRYGIRGAFPIAVMCFALAVATVIVQTHLAIAVAILIVSVAIALLAPVLLPARWVEPRWLREEEAREERGEPSTLPMPRQGRRLVVKPWQYWTGWALIAVMVALSVKFDLGAAAIGGGLAGAIPAMLALRRSMTKTQQADRR